MITTSIISVLLSVTSICTNLQNGFKSTELENITQIFVSPGAVKTEKIEKRRKFLFWKLPHKKIIVIDRFVNSEGKVIFKKTSKSICSLDACSERKFRRIKVVKNEVWIFRYNRNPENAIIKRYDLNGKYLGKKN